MASGKNETTSKEKNYWRVKINEPKPNKKNAKFRMSVPDGTEGAQSEVKDGKTYFFIESDFIEGKIQKIWFWTDESKDKTKRWDCMSIDLTDENGVNECITLNVTSSECQDFLKRLPSVNYQLPTKLVVYAIENDKGFWNTYLVAYQNGEKITSPYTKDSPLPDFEPVTVNGKVVWDKTKFLAALRENGENFNKRLNSQHEFSQSEAESNEQGTVNKKSKSK